MEDGLDGGRREEIVSISKHSGYSSTIGMEDEQDDDIFIPNVSNDLIPANQKFKSVEEVGVFYNTYASAAGFSIHILTSKKNKEGTGVGWRMFVCYKEGIIDETYQNNIKHTMARTGERNRGRIRCGCKARMSARIDKNSGMWVVGLSIVQHNHPLTTPSRVHMLRSHRNIFTPQKLLMSKLSDANVKTCLINRFLEVDSGGPSKVGFMERDIRNLQAVKRAKMSGHDAENLIQQFEMEKIRNEHFHYAYEVDSEGILDRLFWCDFNSRNSYAYFGEVVVFDTTYCTNKYNMYLAPILGVNHHKQTTTFGFGVLMHQNTNSFVWLFSKFVDAMRGQPHPEIIITDQDRAIGSAVSHVFPVAIHRFCIWHILYKLSEKLGPHHYKEYGDRLSNVVNKSDSPEVFETEWGKLTNGTDLQSNEWLIEMYELRHQWVPAYLRHQFSAGMSSSQRAESNHNFIKSYVNPKIGLNELFTRLQRAVIHQRHNELISTHVDLNEVPRLVTPFDMEEQMSKIYTKSIFLLFQQELKDSAHYLCFESNNNDETTEYIVKRFHPEKEIVKRRTLTHYKETDWITCICLMFEFDGYPCRHMLCFMRCRQIILLPKKYVKRR